MWAGWGHLAAARPKAIEARMSLDQPRHHATARCSWPRKVIAMGVGVMNMQKWRFSVLQPSTLGVVGGLEKNERHVAMMSGAE